MLDSCSAQPKPIINSFYKALFSIAMRLCLSIYLCCPSNLRMFRIGKILWIVELELCLWYFQLQWRTLKIFQIPFQILNEELIRIFEDLSTTHSYEDSSLVPSFCFKQTKLTSECVSTERKMKIFKQVRKSKRVKKERKEKREGKKRSHSCQYFLDLSIRNSRRSSLWLPPINSPILGNNKSIAATV